jgi:hypothetical protein
MSQKLWGCQQKPLLHIVQLPTGDPVFEQIAAIGGGVRLGFDGHYKMHQILACMHLKNDPQKAKQDLAEQR